ncbi:1,2-phenylacetyl-CoA epoxidase subunit PaaD [Gulosibacter sp. ACHW.36C]|jgi:ring-1,2-phenylacetyl-CoA epoxidase subunit PaaD|uniref:Phenylacetate-CoA oxygenase subunit PaaJ n=1 Tax=Gulosibacter sediminis TaxID=1729695 RepID=A0ABY4MTV5_9MICO|nr:1,2-phenylacetyl-CoA epoxidase subunit PaaD [Gulosibacter sediminis]UQN13847.1 phenylacetate-CoA oxygenase subunit PaaJ [Gulosibacter sediminis]
MNTQVHPHTSTRPLDARAGAVWDIAAQVADPEIPVLSIADLGILRDALVADDGTAQVIITPTYSGCPAMGTIKQDLLHALESAGYADPEVVLVLAPAWSTDWITDEGKRKLAEYGIAPPSGQSAVGAQRGATRLSLSVRCPRCGSIQTNELSRFGSTSCKALYQCAECKEPFDYFKVH